MKNILCVFMVLTLMVSTNLSYAQLTKEQENERKELSKMTKSELSAKADKLARKQAKHLTKQGWLVSPGGLPLEKQLDRAYNMQYEMDENMLPKYIIADAISIGENYDAAKMQAIELAKQNAAGFIQTTITNLIENTLANEQLSKEEAASITQTVSASKNLISQTLGRTISLVEVYRVKSNKNKEVSVTLAYNADMALKAAKAVIKEELRKKGDNLHEQLDKIMGF